MPAGPDNSEIRQTQPNQACHAEPISAGLNLSLPAKHR